MSKEELEIEYTPSLFSKRFPTRDELLNHFVKFGFDESEKTRKEFDCHLNISYGNTKRQKLDIYGDDLPENAPLFIFIHGGYWQMLEKESAAFVSQPFVRKGIRCLLPTYDLCPSVTLKEIVDEMKNLFTWIANYIKQKAIKSVVISGHSAGAHLLAFGLSNSFLNELPNDVRVDAIFLSGVFYLDELRNLDAANEKNILGLNDSNYEELSPQYRNFDYFSNFNVKVHIFAGEFESEKFREHSKKFAEGPMRDYVENLKFIDCDHFDMVEKFVYDDDYELTHLILKKLTRDHEN